MVKIRKQGGHKTRVVHINRIRKVKDLTKLNLEENGTPMEGPEGNPAEAVVTQARGVSRWPSTDHWRQIREEKEEETKEERNYVTCRTYGRYGPFGRWTTREFKQFQFNCQHEHSGEREEPFREEREKDRQDQDGHRGLMRTIASKDPRRAPGPLHYGPARGGPPTACRAAGRGAKGHEEGVCHQEEKVHDPSGT